MTVASVRSPAITDTAEIGPLLSQLDVRPEGRSRAGRRFVVEVPEGAPDVAPAAFLRALRNALVHEGRLTELVQGLGRDVDTEEFLGILEEVVGRVGVPAREDSARQFTEAEAAELEKAGVDLSAEPAAKGGAAARTAALYGHLLVTALSTAEAAELLDVEESRIRQRLQERTLCGVKVGRAWRLPRFQFLDSGVVPGLGKVLRRLPDDVGLVALFRWLTTASPDLVIDGEPVAPIEWLEAGQDPGVVAEVAAEL